jgi:hypothetical protein
MSSKRPNLDRRRRLLFPARLIAPEGGARSRVVRHAPYVSFPMTRGSRVATCLRVGARDVASLSSAEMANSRGFTHMEHAHADAPSPRACRSLVRQHPTVGLATRSRELEDLRHRHDTSRGGGCWRRDSEHLGLARCVAFATEGCQAMDAAATCCRTKYASLSARVPCFNRLVEPMSGQPVNQKHQNGETVNDEPAPRNAAVIRWARP